MSFATLYVIAPADELPLYAVGTLPDGRLVIHGAPGAPIPEGAAVVRDGTAEWKWCQIAAECPDWLALVTPHEWAGEPSCCTLGADLFAAAKPPIDLDPPGEGA